MTSRPLPLRRALAFTALLAALVALPAFTTTARAATLEHDLQQGLHYLRTADLAVDSATVEKTLATRPALVLDLRHTTADDDTSATLGRLLSRPPATVRFARLILVSKATAPSLLKQLATPHPGVVILSAQTEGLTPDISVGTTPEDDALAYDAFASGVSLDKLLSGTTPQKARYDEATLVRDHANGTNGRTPPADEPELEPAPTSDQPAPADVPVATVEKPAPQPVDRVLLRAVQLHRTLLALKKL
ncbi:hypothetical protein CMV30_04020 [Nibricoccus aquaticus]|uniref:Uncharacterized protein n=1 Tax=Nibricoccus aquaticus TaxID=2576891 RepID=A0A290Q4G7_9BACT|nr:hypothetical protein [Nibricoccus aquaticus]ATC63187.1 hypothetical protein CMV30_04020 [Nibricoccus aquaticus]